MSALKVKEIPEDLARTLVTSDIGHKIVSSVMTQHLKGVKIRRNTYGLKVRHRKYIPNFETSSWGRMLCPIGCVLVDNPATPVSEEQAAIISGTKDTIPLDLNGDEPMWYSEYSADAATLLGVSSSFITGFTHTLDNGYLCVPQSLGVSEEYEKGYKQGGQMALAFLQTHGDVII